MASFLSSKNMKKQFGHASGPAVTGTRSVKAMSGLAHLDEHTILNPITDINDFITTVDKILDKSGWSGKKKWTKSTAKAKNDAIQAAVGKMLIQMFQQAGGDIIQNSNKIKEVERIINEKLKEIKLNTKKTTQVMQKSATTDDGIETWDGTNFFNTVLSVNLGQLTKQVRQQKGKSGKTKSYRQEYLEPVGAQTQCNAIIRERYDLGKWDEFITILKRDGYSVPEKKTSPYTEQDRLETLDFYLKHVNCYICSLGFEEALDGNGVSGGGKECEHVLPVFEALRHLWLVRNVADMKTYSDDEKNVLNLEYEYSHRCCNQAKRAKPYIKWEAGVCKVNNKAINTTYKVMIDWAKSNTNGCPDIIDRFISNNKKLNKAKKVVTHRMGGIIEQINSCQQEFITHAVSSGKRNALDGSSYYQAWTKLKALSAINGAQMFDLFFQWDLEETDITWEEIVETLGTESGKTSRSQKGKGKQGGGVKMTLEELIQKIEIIKANYGYTEKDIVFWAFLTFGYPNLNIDPPTMIYSESGTTIQLKIFDNEINLTNEDLTNPSEDLQNLKNFVWNKYNEPVITMKQLENLPTEPIGYAGYLKSPTQTMVTAGGRKKRRFKYKKYKTRRKNKYKGKNKSRKNRKSRKKQ